MIVYLLSLETTFKFHAMMLFVSAHVCVEVNQTKVFLSRSCFLRIYSYFFFYFWFDGSLTLKSSNSLLSPSKCDANLLAPV